MARPRHRPEFIALMAWKQPVRVATTASITISTALNNGDAIDGVTLTTGDRVLVKDQATGSQNGIYVVGASPIRAHDMNLGAEVPGAFIYVIAGTVNGGKVFHATNTSIPTLGVTALVFAEYTTPAGATLDEGIAILLDHGTVGATETIDQSAAMAHVITLDVNCTLTFTGAVATVGSDDVECAFRLYVIQDGSGGNTITWPGSVVWPGGSAPTLSTTASSVEILDFTTPDGGTTWYGFHSGTLADHDHSASGAQGGATLSPVTLNLPATNSPAQTANGQVVWDSDDDVLTVGTGAARRTFGYLGSTTPIVESGSGSAGSSKETSAADHVHPAASSSSGGTGDHEHMIDVFNGDAATAAFEITDEPLDPEQVFAFVGGSWTAVTVSGAMNTIVTFGAAPGSGTGNVVIQYPAVSA